MKYSIDRIEDKIAIIEDIITGEKKEINIALLPVNIKEGNIIKERNNVYIRDIETEKTRRTNLIYKFNSLKKK